MNAIARRDPFAGLVGIRRLVDRFFGDPFFGFHGYAAPTYHANPIPVDVTADEKQVVIRASLPGVKPEDVKVSIEDNRLAIDGQSQSDKESETDRYVLRERYAGAFQRRLTLPQGLRGDDAEAHFENGVLTLTIPRVPAIEPKTIEVKTG